MSEIKHTPGPWTLETVRTSMGICHKIGPFPWKDGKQNSACVYVDYPGNGEIEAELLANARLIAAAPELLEAIKEAIETIKFLSTRDNSWGEQIVCEDLQAIVAKATGSQS